jgi:hypothetical protein
MSKKDKLVERFKNRPADFTWAELEKLLTGLGYQQEKTGKTGGSRRKFIHATGPLISLHKPHPKEILKAYQVKQVLEVLEKEEMI